MYSEQMHVVKCVVVGRCKIMYSCTQCKVCSRLHPDADFLLPAFYVKLVGLMSADCLCMCAFI